MPAAVAARKRMPATQPRKAGKRSIGKAKKVKNVSLKRTKGVCTLPLQIFTQPTENGCTAMYTDIGQVVEARWMVKMISPAQTPK